MSYPLVEAGELMARRNGSLDPSKFPDEEFELHSIPAYDAGRPDLQLGRNIGSAKQLVEPNDVMISKIVPHIRRAEVVGPFQGLRQIASGEWIVFRSDRIYPNYFRHVLLSGQFNASFMATVSGVGGSLLRARPAEVAKIKVPLPPLAEQRRIASILDKADALRAKRRETIAKLDQLLQSVFLDMFGDGAIFSRLPIGAICEVKGGKRLPKGEDYAEEPTPYRYIRVSDIAMGQIQEDGLKYLKPDVQARVKRYTVAAGDVIITIAGTIGVVAPVGKSLSGANLTENAAKLVAKKRGEFVPEYLAFALGMPEAQTQIRSQTGQVTIGKLALFRIEKVEIPLPPVDLQRKFASIAEAVSKQKIVLSRNVEQMDSMFISLQNRAFAGTL